MFKLNPVVMADNETVSFTNYIYTRNDILLRYNPIRWVIPDIGFFIPAFMGDDGLMDAIAGDTVNEYIKTHPATQSTRGFIILPDKKRIKKIVGIDYNNVFYDLFDVSRHEFVGLSAYGDIETYLNTTLNVLRDKRVKKNHLLSKMERAMEDAFMKSSAVYQERIHWDTLTHLLANPSVALRCREKLWTLVKQ